MNELEWFKLALWLGLLIIGFIFRKPVITLLDAVFGIYQALGLYSDGAMIALILVCVNLYLGYESLENWDLG